MQHIFVRTIRPVRDGRETQPRAAQPPCEKVIYEVSVRYSSGPPVSGRGSIGVYGVKTKPPPQ